MRSIKLVFYSNFSNFIRNLLTMLLFPSLEGRRGGLVITNKKMKRKILPYNSKLKSLAKALRNDMTFSEVLLWNELKQKKCWDMILTVSVLLTITLLISTVKV